MQSNSAWDWPLLMYAGTVLLNKTQKQFWKLLPRVLSTLIKVHTELNSGKDKKNKEIGYIDQVF